MSSGKGARVTWLGHSTMLVESGKGVKILIDPYIKGNPSYPKDFVLPEKIDYILLTHGHGDHIGDAVPVAKKCDATVVAVFELASYIESKGVAKTIGMNVGGTVQLGDVAVTMVDAKHSAAAIDEKGVHYVGVATGFVLRPENGPALYHSGDTAVFGDMKLIAELYKPEIVMIPIGDHYTMGPQEAALAVKLLSPKTVLPMHFGTFPVLTGTPEALAKLVGPGVQVVAWKPGDSF
jgi:L-ascorbate metabolism protein UlaG (beta-lactamase superfamily)